MDDFPPKDTLRILVATDNHLGFLASDPVRGEDSFETMDEILQIGRDKHCDCVFLSGDLVCSSFSCLLSRLNC